MVGMGLRACSVVGAGLGAWTVKEASSVMGVGFGASTVEEA